MPVQILMPALSPTMTEGNLVRWLKNEGDTIKAGQVLAEIETDKATMEVEAVDEGILGKILIAAGTDEVKVNEVIALLLEEGEDASALANFTPKAVAAPQANADATPSSQTASSTMSQAIDTASSSGERIIASPVAKRIASDKGVNLSHIPGTGPRGRILKADVEGFSGSATTHSSQPVSFAHSGYTDIPLNNMRKVIAKRLLESKQSIPHFYLSVSCEIDALLALRTQINASKEKDEKISVNDFVILACARALRDVPDVNVSFHDNIIRKYANADISVAVAIDGGLVTPIITNVGARSLTDVSSTMKKLAKRAREGKLQPEEFQGGSFCISNLGMYGVDHFQAIINPPQACILAIGAGKEQVVVKEGEMQLATVMTCTLSVDHRAVDGALGATFLGKLKLYLENPINMLV